jgi:hypothetical protein
MRSVVPSLFPYLIWADCQQFKVRLTASMIIDFIGCWVIEQVCKYLFADLEPKSIVTRGRERRERRRAAEELGKAGHKSLLPRRRRQ